MQNNKKRISLFLYFLSLTVLVSPWLFVVLVSKDFILAGAGIGIYGVNIYYAAAFVSALLWSVSFALKRDSRLAIIYWLIFCALTLSIALQPTWWAAPEIANI